MLGNKKAAPFPIILSSHILITIPVVRKFQAKSSNFQFLISLVCVNSLLVLSSLLDDRFPKKELKFRSNKFRDICVLCHLHGLFVACLIMGWVF